MKSQLCRVFLASLTVVTITVACAEYNFAAQKNAANVRIGIYDSRAVAAAYTGTPLHEAETKTLNEALNEAMVTGIPEKVLASQNAIWDARKRLHRQGFSTFPVDDLLAKIPTEITSIQQQEEVTALVSKWDKKGLAKYKHAERVDVTGQLVDAFHPNDRQRKSAEAIQKVKPLSPKAVEKAIAREAKH